MHCACRCQFVHVRSRKSGFRIKQLPAATFTQHIFSRLQAPTIGDDRADFARAWTLAHAQNGLAARTPRAARTHQRLHAAGVFFRPRSGATRYAATDARTIARHGETSTGGAARRTRAATCRDGTAVEVKTCSPQGIPRGMCASLSIPRALPGACFSVSRSRAGAARLHPHPFGPRCAAVRCGFRCSLDVMTAGRAGRALVGALRLIDRAYHLS